MPAKASTARALTAAAHKATHWTARRDQLIRQAVAEGGSLREVGALAGLSHTAVKLISARPPVSLSDSTQGDTP